MTAGSILPNPLGFHHHHPRSRSLLWTRRWATHLPHSKLQSMESDDKEGEGVDKYDNGTTDGDDGDSDKTAVEAFSDRKYFESDIPLTDAKYQSYLEDMKLRLGTMTLNDFFNEALSEEKTKEDRDKALKYLRGKLVGCNEDMVAEFYDEWKKVNVISTTDSEPLRMVSTAYQIQDTKLSHKYDLECFSERIEELFNWWLESNWKKKFLGPYLCFIQSSGMGKTKLMYEFKHRNPDATVAAFLILPNSITFPTEEKGVFDYQLGLGKIVKDVEGRAVDSPLQEAANEVYESLDTMLKHIMDNNQNCNRIVLLFDESHSLLKKFKGYDAFLFRCIRMWLRVIREDGMQLVAVFAGTNSRLANFIIRDDSALEFEEASSRQPVQDGRKYADKGRLFIPIFYQTTTTGARLDVERVDPDVCEYVRAIPYGRPLFAVMAKQGILDGNIPSVLTRMLLLDGHNKDWEKNRNVWINLLSTRVQMGQTTLAVTSDLIAKGYANLAGYFEEAEAAQLAYLPDPVCARLSMCMMDENFRSALAKPYGEAFGKNKQWWTEKVTEIFSSGIVSPEKGDFGEVVVALYMLFCADLLRKTTQDNRFKTIDVEDVRRVQQPYIHFSVSLNEWFYVMQSGGKMQEASSEDATPDVSVGFIQVCRSSLRSYSTSWKSLSDQGFLRHVYESGTAFYVYPGCPLIDLVIPLRVASPTESQVHYVPMLVSIKCRSSFPKSDVDKVRQAMLHQAHTDELQSALCLLIIFGGEGAGSQNHSTFLNVANEVRNKVVFEVIRVPHDDVFGLSEAFNAMTPTSQMHTEMFTSHPYLRAHGSHSDLVSSNAMRKGTPKHLLDAYDRMRNALVQKKSDHGEKFEDGNDVQV